MRKNKNIEKHGFKKMKCKYCEIVQSPMTRDWDGRIICWDYYYTSKCENRKMNQETINSEMEKRKKLHSMPYDEYKELYGGN